MNNPETLKKGKYICLGLGILFFLMAFTANGAPQEASAAAMGCFMGILSRIFQAEEHYLTK